MLGNTIPNEITMKVYIAGKITGLPYEEVKEKFTWASEQIRKLGFTPISPINKDLPYDADWHEHMVQDINLLLGCEAIYLQMDWENSKGARIEQYIAKEMGMLIIYQLPFSAWTKEEKHEPKKKT